MVSGSTPQSADIGTAFANPLAVIVTANNPVEPVDGGIVTFVANCGQRCYGDLFGILGRYREGAGEHHRGPDNVSANIKSMRLPRSSLLHSI